MECESYSPESGKEPIPELRTGSKFLQIHTINPLFFRFVGAVVSRALDGNQPAGQYEGGIMLKRVALLLMIGWAGCNRVPSGTDNSEKEYIYQDVLCPNMSVAKIEPGADFLYFWDFQDGKLSLDFQFDCTCNSAYEETVTLSENLLEILLADTSSMHARCMCWHESRFKIPVSDPDGLRLVLKIRHFSSDEFETCVDTMLDWGS